MLLRLLQLTSPSLPIGAYSYSEGLESLVETHQITSAAALEHWILQELHYGAIRVEAAIALRAHRAVAGQSGDLDHSMSSRHTTLRFWNAWLTASRETEELRRQSLQMGRSLVRLWQDLEPDRAATLADEDYHFAVAFGLIAAHWEIDEPSTALGYLHSWASNLISAGIKLVPIGQTAGQQLLLRLGPVLESTALAVLALPDDDLESCGYGLALASMAHETQYSRLFRS
jgi:urease accessory protein